MGAMGDTYATLEELKTYLSIDAGEQRMDVSLSAALDSCSREIERHCNRQFNREETASARVYEPDSPYCVFVDDFYDAAGLLVDVDGAGNGDFNISIPAAEYEVSPFNGIVDGQPGWPYWKIRTTTWRLLQRPWGRRATVRVTAKWGWTSVPAPVHQACLILAAETFQLKDAALGVVGMDAFGAPVRVRDNKMAESKLMRYTRDPILVG